MAAGETKRGFEQAPVVGKKLVTYVFLMPPMCF
jgi:hypothetical protein